MTSGKTILVIGTYDTKADELIYLEQMIRSMGADLVSMDISILGTSDWPVDIPKHRIAAAAGTTIPEIIALGEESLAMDAMARGASILARRLVAEGRIHGLISMGGTMGTDLALDVCQSLRLGFPKYIVSTVAFSAVISPDRLSPDIQMILWAGGLYGLNDLCRATLAQAAGAVVGAAMTAQSIRMDRPLIGMSSLGNTALSYMRKINPALEERGYDVAVFHSTGMGGRAMESMAEQGMFAAVLDLCLQEFSNGLYGSVVSSGDDRLVGAGRAGVPLIVAPGAADLVDWPTWASVPEIWRDRPIHKHNKLISSLTLSRAEREHVARETAERLRGAVGPVHVLMPLRGVEGWDREGEIAHAPDDLAAYYAELQRQLDGAVPYTAIDCHINDDAFSQAVLEVFDEWCAKGVIAPAAELRERA